MGWNPRQIGDLSGRTAVVTGANSGIGRHEAAQLAEHGARVVLAVRDVDSGRAAAEGMKGDVRVAHLDLASLASVRAFAEGIEEPLDLLVNNAGLMEPPRYRETVDGHELQFGTNHLGHFALTALLLPRLLQAAAPRVTTVSSIAHFRGTDAVLEGNPPQTYVPGTAYGQSKLANLLFALELQRRADRAGLALTSTAAHPGVASTGLVADPDGLGHNPVVRHVLPILMRVVLPGGAGGARPVLYAATDAAPGTYTGPKGPGEVRGPVGEAKQSRFARDESLAARLWSVSEELTGIPFPVEG
ncbi:oxidoreductase [Allobranchiibius sp. GilTou38]|uniref:oxidoreductase n=1 Tax=Allobranchiibius sp. GilTou38 TaxID=2815210 RepID=UPI001AA1CA0F|nr:oxidoreductase [Allobranchiibius sp. GilTou38]MBO1767321.1 SDR family NAD(P)-dependent oxidoreductase [Allobranchiibius sp. GilTou38]